jgi:hypothetical protein
MAKIAQWVTAVVGFAAGVTVFCLFVGWFQLPAVHLSTTKSPLPAPDAPPFEFVYLDSSRVNSYLGQLENGLSQQQQRTAQDTQNVNESLSAGTVAQFANSASKQEGTQETVTVTSADRFYLFLRLLRQGTLPKCVSGAGEDASRWHWMVGASFDPTQARTVMSAVDCAGVGTFIRLSNMQLFLPPFAQVLPSAQSVSTVYGNTPWRRFPFTSPTQSTKPSDIHNYVKTVGKNPRMPFLGAPFGSGWPIGAGADNVTFFLPMAYRGLTFEPSLLSGPVNVVGKIVAFADPPRKGKGKRKSYIDYPTISEFGQALLRQSPAFDNGLGVCATAPPPAVLSKPPNEKPGVGARNTPGEARGPKPSTCPSTGSVLRAGPVLKAIKRSVTLQAPYVVVLPLAIYQ